MEPPAVRTEALSRVYRRPKKRGEKGKTDANPDFVALDGVNLEVRPGELFGLLGPNGAGKTTLIKILTTLLAPSSGTAQVDGLDVVSQASLLRPRINMVSGGESSGYGILNVRENLWLFARMYGVPTAVAKERIDKMIGVVGLEDKAGSRITHLSTGQRQKMNFCRGFITDPKVLFLDEPTLGLDVTSARAIRAFVKEWIAEKAGRTLLLTTHYMAEADELCDRLAIIDRGKVLACDTPANLKRRVQEYPMFELTLAPGANGAADVGHIPGVHHATTEETPTTVQLKVSLRDEPAIGAVVQKVVTSGGRILTLKKVEPTLEDVFIELVGHGLNDAASANGGAVVTSSLNLFYAAASARTYPRVAWLFRSRTWFLQETVLPVLAVAASAMAYDAMDAPRTYAGVVVLGAAMTTFWMNVLWGMGAQLYWERDSGNLELYVMSPAPITAVLTGMALGGMTTTVIRAGAITAAGMFIFGVPVAPTSWALLIGVFVLTLAALYGLGMMFASLFLRWGREAYHLVSALQEPVYLLSGTNFPLAAVLRDGPAKAVALGASILPLTAGMDAMRQVLFGTPGIMSVTAEMGLMAVLAVVFFAVARRSLRHMERRAKETGMLTVRWQ